MDVLVYGVFLLSRVLHVLSIKCVDVPCNVRLMVHLFVADHLGATFAVVEVMGDSNHAHCVEVIRGSSLN